MKSLRRQQLREELREAGASLAEVKALLPIASRLSTLNNNSNPTISKGVSTAPNFWLKVAKPTALAAFGLALGMYLVVISQATLPTSRLYTIQKLSDTIAADMHPQYRANIMMKRAQQVNALVAGHASSQQILATLADYTKEAGAYKSLSDGSYAAFEYCKTNLQQAASGASPDIRQAIAASLQSLDAT
jgi:hypothetical protein